LVREIRESSVTHPAEALQDELDQINDCSAQCHHGENVADGIPDHIDPTEQLTGYVGRTLRVVNVLQARSRRLVSELGRFPWGARPAE